MTREVAQYWLVDTNIIIDLLSGIVCYAVVKTMGSRGRKHCSTSLIKEDIIGDTGSSQLRDNIYKTATLVLEKLLSIGSYGTRLTVSSVTVKEAHQVIKKLLKQSQQYKQYRSRRYYVVLLPAQYLVDYSNLLKYFLDRVDKINVSGKYSEAIAVINKHLGGRFDNEDWHLIAALITNKDIKAAYSEEDAVIRGLKKVAEKALGRKGFTTGGLTSLLANLRTLGIASQEQVNTIQYYAYKFQRLLHSHSSVC